MIKANRSKLFFFFFFVSLYQFIFLYLENHASIHNFIFVIICSYGCSSSSIHRRYSIHFSKRFNSSIIGTSYASSLRCRIRLYQYVRTG
ncbi:hypothetical protein PGB90_006117 [Kerria lacca]